MDHRAGIGRGRSGSSPLQRAGESQYAATARALGGRHPLRLTAGEIERLIRAGYLLSVLSGRQAIGAAVEAFIADNLP